MQQRSFLLPLLLFLLAALPAGAGDYPPKSIEAVSIQLNWKHQFEFAPVYAALEKGFYREAGLAVRIREGGPEIDAVDEVTEGRSDFGIFSSALLVERSRGKPVVALAALMQHSAVGILALRSAGIGSVHDLAGKRIALSLDTRDELQAYFRAVGIPSGKIDIIETSDLGLDHLANGDAQALAVYVSNEPFLTRGREHEYLLFTPRAAGIDLFGDVLFTTEAQAEAHPRRVERFRRATLKGLEYALAHPEEIADLILAHYNTQRKSRDHLLFEAGQIRELTRLDVVEPGYMNPGRWAHAAEVYAGLGKMPAGFKLDGFVYDPHPHTDYRWLTWLLAGTVLLLGVLSVTAWQSRRYNRRLEIEIQERGAAEERERAARNLLQSVLDAIPSRVFWKDRDSRYLGCNARCALDAGLDSPEAIVGRTDRELAWADRAESFRADDLKIMETGQARINYESTAPMADGRLIHVNATKMPLRGGHGEIIGLVGAYRDITDYKLVEHKLRLLASVFENAHEGIIITDSQATIVDVNQAFIRLTGYSRNEVIGNTPRLLKSGHHSEDFYATLWRDLRERGHWRGEIWNRRKDGALYAELLDISAVHSLDGTVSHYVGIFSDITLLKEHQLQLEQMAHYDALTQLPNRVLLASRLEAALIEARKSDGMLAVAYLDLDGFKPVNDTLGHEAGDQLLMAVAERLKGCIKGRDTVARLGGDEFVILLAGLHSTEGCCRAMDRIIAVLCEPYRIRDEDIRISASIGVSLYPLDNSDPDTLMRHADQAMYTAKQSGRNRYHVFNPEHDRRQQDHMELLSRIEAALGRREFVLHYQPKIDMRRNIVTGAEALIRWQHPELGLLPPSEFLPVIENRDFAVHLGRWVLLEAIGQLEAWWDSGLPIKISINISARHLQDDSFVEDIRKALAAHPGVPPTAVELEVLETMALEDMARVSRVIRECRDLGVQFALDDFGTGYSSLTYFRRLPLDTLKIDQSFVKDMLMDSEDHAIVEGVIALAHAFNRRVVAEGVESIQHGQILMQLGCDHGQGYGIARPMPAGDLPGWARSFAASPPWNGAAREPVREARSAKSA
jgi:diguanylate cyclase (GGDEF)-like protein/PAS domain S-box-containing protein